MKLSLMTLGCPAWDLGTICARAQEYGFDGIDFRGVGSELDVTRLPAFTTGAAATARAIADHGLRVSGISSSIRVCAPERRAADLDEARRTIEVALALGAPNVRVFGEGAPDRIGKLEAARIGTDRLREILDIPGAQGLSWNFETHDHWVRSDDCLLLLDAIDDPAFGCAWDIAHTRRTAGETAAQSLDALYTRLRYVHVKDAARTTPGDPRAMSDGWRYVLPGTGELDIDGGIAALRERGYDGWLMFEHEKRWHPELEEPEVAFPAFVAWGRRLIDG